MIKKGFVIISFAFIFLLSMSIVFANDNLNQNEKISFGKWLKGLWGKITGNPIFQRGGEQTPSLAPIENNQNRNLFSRAPSSQIQTSPTDFSDKEDKEISLEITKKSEEIKELTSNLLELNNQYKKISSVKSSKKKIILSELEKLAIERKKVMIELAKENPVLFFNNVMSKDKRELFTDKIKEHIEEEVIIEGNLLTLHIDDFKDINAPVSKFEYFIITKENKKINFYPIIPSEFISEANIKVSGYKIDENIVGFVKEIKIKEKIKDDEGIAKNIKPTPQIPKIPEEHKIAVILVNFLDSPPSPFTPAEANDLIFNGQFQNFYKEQSYNKIYFTGDVFGWFTLPRDSQSNCMVSIGWGQELDSYIINNNIDLNNYDHLLVLGGGCVYGPSDYGVAFSTLGKVTLLIEDSNTQLLIPNISLAMIVGENYLITDNNLDFISIHEIGHSLGVLHANGHDCGEHSYYLNNNYINCQHLEYGNYFDMMGANGGFAFHFNAFYKEILGWISPQDSLSITQSGTYTINVLETSQGKKFAKIKMLESSAFDVSNLEKSLKSSYYPYYLEYRKGVGFDSTLNNPDLISNQNGLLINKIFYDPISPKRSFPRLLDMNASLLEWGDDSKSASLSGNNIFNDPRTGITIGPIIDSTPTSITFNVSLQKTNCIREQPIFEIKINPSQENIYDAGNLIVFSFDILNTDYPICDSSKFKIMTANLPQGFSSFTDERDIFPLEKPYFGAHTQTSSTLCTGSYPISFSVENLNSGLITTKTIYVNINGASLCPSDIVPPEF